MSGAGAGSHVRRRGLNQQAGEHKLHTEDPAADALAVSGPRQSLIKK